MSRTEHLRRSLGWSQPEMSHYLGQNQSSVSRLESGVIEESGPVSRLLDALASALASGEARPGMSPRECLAALGMARSESGAA